MKTEFLVAFTGVAGTLIGVWLGSFLSDKTSKRILFEQAKSEFINSFSNTIIKLNASIKERGIGEPTSVLENDYLLHYSAYLKLLASTPDNKHSDIESAWSSYTKNEDDELIEEQELYRFSHTLMAKNDEEMQMLARKHVNRLVFSIKKT